MTRQSFEVRSVCAWPNGSKTTPLRIRLRRLALPSWLLLRHRPVAAILERAKHRLHVGRRRIYFPKPSRPIVGCRIAGIRSVIFEISVLAGVVTWMKVSRVSVPLVLLV